MTQKQNTSQGESMLSPDNENFKNKMMKDVETEDKHNPSDDSEGSMLDLKENLMPISHYIKDRNQLLNEMFRCITGHKLRSMLPEVLKVLKGILYNKSFTTPLLHKLTGANVYKKIIC